MLPIYRFLIAVVVVNGLLNAVLLNFVLDDRLVPLVTALWMAFGYVRVFGRNLAADTFQRAFKGVMMALAWPLVPRSQ